MLSKDTFKKVKRHQIGETYAKQIFYKGLYLDYIEPLQSNNKKTKKPKKKWINYLNSYFSKEYIKMAKQHMKDKQGKQIKVTMRNYFTAIRIARTKKSHINQFLQEYREVRVLKLSWQECKRVPQLWITVQCFLQQTHDYHMTQQFFSQIHIQRNGIISTVNLTYIHVNSMIIHKNQKVETI